MTSPETRSIKDFTVAHKLRALGGKGLIGCMDRRLVMPNDPVLGGDKLFQQIRGGRYGTGHGLALAMETVRPGSFTGLQIPVANFAQGVGFALELAGILTTKHGPTCGAIEGASVIHEGVAAGADDETMFRNAQLLNPNLTEDYYTKTVAAAQRIGGMGLSSSPKEVKRVLTTPAGIIPSTSTPHVELRETNHDSVRFATDYRPGMAFDRAEAHAHGLGAYYSSFGAFEEILQAVPDSVSEIVRLEDWWATEAVVLGRIATYDITHHGTPYGIEAIS